MQTLIRLASRGAHGRLWYDKAHDALCDWAHANGWPVRDVLAAVACTSPRTPVSRNMDKALALLTDCEMGDTPLPIHLYLWEKYKNTGTLVATRRNRKVARFFAALCGAQDAVPIDVWMMRACKTGAGPRAQDTAEKAVRTVATRLGWTPTETQAAIWTGMYEKCTGHTAPEIEYVHV